VLRYSAWACNLHHLEDSLNRCYENVEYPAHGITNLHAGSARMIIGMNARQTGINHGGRVGMISEQEASEGRTLYERERAGVEQSVDRECSSW
jgi:hypothetical protein